MLENAEKNEKKKGKKKGGRDNSNYGGKKLVER